MKRLSKIVISIQTYLPTRQVYRKSSLYPKLNYNNKDSFSILFFEYVFLLLFFYLSVSSYGQTHNREKLDSLYNTYLSIRSHSSEAYTGRIVQENPADIKCGFGLAWEIKRNFERFTIEQQIVLRKLLQRPSKQTSMVSDSGFFRIHYDTTGLEVPNYNPEFTIEENVSEVAAALDSTYNFEVNFLGYLKPPQDNNGGGDNLYDVYITIPLGYGSTSTETYLGDQKYTTYIEIHYDYKNFYTKGFDAMRVTIAHEFHHAIQLGSYTGDKADFDLFFYELTSTSMEEFVFDNVNDYYVYMPDYFQNIDRSFASNDGYNLAIWNLFLIERFKLNDNAKPEGFGIIKKQWELMPNMRALQAINTSINELTATFNDVFNEFGVWTYFTNRRSVEGKYFDEAENYPLVKPIMSTQFTPPEKQITYNAKPLSNGLITIINSTINPDDTLDILISNSDYINGINNTGATFQVNYYLYDYPAEGSRRLSENFNYYAKTNVNSPSLWSTAEFRNGELINVAKYISTADFPYPSPFRYGKNNFIFIPVKQAESDLIDFNVYSSSMDLVYSVSKNLDRLNEQSGISWNVLDNKNQRMSTGVYIYVIKSSDEIIKGKIAIFNE